MNYVEDKKCPFYGSTKKNIKENSKAIIKVIPASSKVKLNIFSPCYLYNITSYDNPSRTKNVRFQFNLIMLPMAQMMLFVGSSIKAI